MMNLTSERKRKISAFVIGLLFLILGSATQAETSWLFTLGGMLAVMQGFYIQFKAGKNKKTPSQ